MILTFDLPKILKMNIIKQPAMLCSLCCYCLYDNVNYTTAVSYSMWRNELLSRILRSPSAFLG